MAAEPVPALAQYENAATPAQAEQALDALDRENLPDTVNLGDLYDELAQTAAEAEDFTRAVRAQRKAIDNHCSSQEQGRQKLAWYLLKDGQRDAGEELFGQLRREHGGDPYFLLTLANARADAGHVDAALLAFDEALTVAKQHPDSDVLSEVRNERAGYRAQRGLEPDADDLAAPQAAGPAMAEVWTLAWFPLDERPRAVELWPDLAGDLNDDEGYRRALELELRELSTHSTRHPRLVALDVDALTEFATSHALDPGSPEARNEFAAAQSEAGAGEPWPPGRNEPCWCGSGRKYKRCCGAF